MARKERSRKRSMGQPTNAGGDGEMFRAESGAVAEYPTSLMRWISLAFIP